MEKGGDGGNYNRDNNVGCYQTEAYWRDNKTVRRVSGEEKRLDNKLRDEQG